MITEEIVGNQPCLRTPLKGLQLFLDGLDLSRVASVGRIVELGDKLKGKLEILKTSFDRSPCGGALLTDLASSRRGCTCEPWPGTSIEAAMPQGSEKGCIVGPAARVKGCHVLIALSRKGKAVRRWDGGEVLGETQVEVIRERKRKDEFKRQVVFSLADFWAKTIHHM